jgi:Ca2+-binding EF-hand superfamily protein
MAEEAGDGSGEPKWVQIQKKTFTKWMNNHLKKKGYGHIEDAQTAFDDGIKLMELINALYDTKMPAKYNKAPKMRPHKLDNLNLAFGMLEEAKIKTNFLKTTHLADKDLKMILGMIWAIILDYAIKGINVEELTAKEGLLLWCRKKTAGYRDIDPPGIRNFKSDWSNGLAFCALIHKHRPDLISYDSLDAKNAAQNLELAFDVAEKQLGIPRLLDVEDLKNPDERSVMTYVSEYFHRFASQDQKQVAAQRCANFLKFLRDVQVRQSEYERRARALLGWVDERIGEFKHRDFGSTLGEAQEFQSKLRSFVVTDRPQQEGEKIDLENLFAEIQTQLKVNGRRSYVPPEGLTPEDLEQALDRLTGAQKGYAAAVRENRFKYVQKVETKISDEKIAEMKDSFRHFDKNKNGTLDKLEFKAALSAMSVFFASDAELERTFNNLSAGSGHVNLDQYLGFLTSKYEDRDSPDQIKDSFRQVADGSGTISRAQLLTPPLGAEDAEFLASVMPESGGGYDYSAYVDSVFS